ncbi:hypothetical protein OSTOST_03558 [Ostertagia ostertagi]
MREYYTPLWLCAVLMCLLLALVISLFLVFICLHCNHPGIIKQHIMLLAASWPIAVLLTASAVVAGAPLLVGNVVFVAWLIVLLWLLTILVSLIALFTNSYNLLLPHLVWTGFLCAVCTFCSLTLFFYDTRPWTMFLSSGIAVLLGISVVVETKCFLAMRQCLR